MSSEGNGWLEKLSKKPDKIVRVKYSWLPYWCYNYSQLAEIKREYSWDVDGYWVDEVVTSSGKY